MIEATGFTVENKYNAKSTNLDVINWGITQGHIDDAVNVNWLGQFCCRHKIRQD
jgi:hypothetical protein